MNCPKCKGLVVPETCFGEGEWISSARCLGCGWVKYGAVLAEKRKVDEGLHCVYPSSGGGRGWWIHERGEGV